MCKCGVNATRNLRAGAPYATRNPKTRPASGWGAVRLRTRSVLAAPTNRAQATLRQHRRRRARALSLLRPSPTMVEMAPLPHRMTCELLTCGRDAIWSCDRPSCRYSLCPACFQKQLRYRECGLNDVEILFKCPRCAPHEQIVGHSNEFERGENSYFKLICASLTPFGPIVLKHDDDRKNSILFAAFKPRTRCGSNCRGCAESSVIGLHGTQKLNIF